MKEHGWLARWHRWSACDIGEAMWGIGLENEIWCRWGDGRVGEWHSAHSPPLPSRRLTYVTSTSPTSLGKPPMWCWRMRCDVDEVMEGLANDTLLILHPFHHAASPTSQALHLHHLASHPCEGKYEMTDKENLLEESVVKKYWQCTICDIGQWIDHFMKGNPCPKCLIWLLCDYKCGFKMSLTVCTNLCTASANYKFAFMEAKMQREG